MDVSTLEDWRKLNIWPATEVDKLRVLQHVRKVLNKIKRANSLDSSLCGMEYNDEIVTSFPKF